MWSIYVLMYSTPSAECISVMGVRLGAFAMMRRHLFCSTWSCLNVDLLIEHQTGAAYATIDRRAVV